MIDDIYLIKLFTHYNMSDYKLKQDKKGYYYLIYKKNKHIICMTKNREMMKKAIELIGGNL